MTDEDICNRMVICGPETFFRGLHWTHSAMKMHNPELAERCLRLAVEMLGRPRALQVWTCAEEILKPMGST